MGLVRSFVGFSKRNLAVGACRVDRDKFPLIYRGSRPRARYAPAMNQALIRRHLAFGLLGSRHEPEHDYRGQTARLPRTKFLEWHEGYACLAGGTWLFSTPQIATHTLIDLETLRWPALTLSADGLEIAATCTIAELEQFQAPANWTAAPLLKLCCHALLMSFKIYNAATVGGNICMSLPAGAMISLAVGARRRLHAVAAGRQAAQGLRRSISSPATTRMC